MAIFEPKTKKFLCECGCGEECQFYNRFKTGHNMKTEEARRKASERVSGRYWTGEERQHKSNSQILAYMVDPSIVEEISKSLTGVVRSGETCRRMSLAQKRFWDSKEGLKRKEEISREYSDGRRALENHPNWKGGIVSEYGYGWVAIRDFIISRDNFTCQGCGTKVGLEVHHIDGDTNNVEDSNLITVCHSCNMLAAQRDSQDYWIDFYKRKVRSIV